MSGATGVATEAGRAVSAWRELDWRILPPGEEVPPMHMALDDVLLDEVAAGRRPPSLRWWEWTRRAVVLGRFQSVRNEIDPDGAARHGVSLVRRITGGGAMLVEPGNTITFSLYAPESLVAGLTFVESYAFLDTWLIEGLRDLGVDAFYRPINDISSAAGKIGGAAQTRRGGAVLHHVTMAYAMSSGMMLEVLRIGQEKLSDKGVASAAKRVAPLGEGLDLPRHTIMERLEDGFRERHGGAPDTIRADERREAEARVRDRYGTEAWTYLLP